MARTKASVGAKVSFGKSSKAQKTNVQPSSSSGRTKVASKSSWSGGNSYCPRETPQWQLPITRFFCDTQGSKQSDPSSSSSLPQNSDIIATEGESDVEDTVKTPLEEPDIPCHHSEENNELDLTLASEPDLLPLVDDSSSHKIGEYFESVMSKNDEIDGPIKVKLPVKNKGKGKSTKNKNVVVEDVIMRDNVEVMTEKENTNPQGDSDESESKCSSPMKRSFDDFMDGNDEINSFKRIKIST
ncbi:uncharacterized protein LOC143916099 [Arctopsyche grandis]|uniref:uncharacterized protein LOC143916099 n=1 Tax=Arctopsyche grandis TaxID=121162 RepID=UPI00406D9D95